MSRDAVAASSYGPLMHRRHPWRALASHPEITLRWERMPGRLGQWCAFTQTITLHPDQSQAERRSTLTHELRHVAAGHVGACSPLVEEQMDDQAARELISLDDLADALLWSQDEWEVADALWVDVATARDRIDRLTEAEKTYIEGRITAQEGSA